MSLIQCAGRPPARPSLAVRTHLKAGACQPPDCTTCATEARRMACEFNTSMLPCQPPVCRGCQTQSSYEACTGG